MKPGVYDICVCDFDADVIENGKVVQTFKIPRHWKRV